eukprot:6214568-Pleurochrysis_carterae.AAC.5
MRGSRFPLAPHRWPVRGLLYPMSWIGYLVGLTTYFELGVGDRQETTVGGCRWPSCRRGNAKAISLLGPHSSSVWECAALVARRKQRWRQRRPKYVMRCTASAKHPRPRDVAYY